MKNWVVKLLLLLFIPSFVGILFTVILGFNPGGWLQIATYAFPPLLTLAGGAFMVASRWKVPFLILMAAASMAFNIPLQNWPFHSADEVCVIMLLPIYIIWRIMLCILLSILWRWIMPEGAV